MRRTALVLAVVALLVMVTAAPVWAGKPEVFPPEPVDEEGVLESTLCGFEVGFHLEGKEGGIFFEDRAILTAPGGKVKLTNLATGAMVSLKIAGSFHDNVLDDDGNIRTVNVGRNLLFGIFDGEPGLFLTIGKVVTDWNINDLPDNIFEVIESESPGKLIDVCGMLS